MAFLKRLIIPLFALVLTACPYGTGDYEFEYQTIVTESPVNLEGINSPYDDYNSALPYPAARIGIFFSSNRSSAGHDFDIIFREMDLSYHVKDDVLDVHYVEPGDFSSFEDILLTLISSADDQLGPFFFFGPMERSYFFYSDNQNGDYDIRFTHHLKSGFGSYGADEVLHGPDTLKALTTDKDELYPTIMEDQSALFFCSNRENEVFNIYSSPLPEADSLHQFFTSTETVDPDLNAILSSNYDDKCPFINKDILVFTSNREGGQGGFDLYYSLLEDGSWSDPVNFGPEINTEYDEYRPIVFSFSDFNTLMIFSSDRPGGQGGFDLYMVQADGHIQ